MSKTGKRNITSPDNNKKSSEVTSMMKSPQPPRISVCLKNRKRVLLSQQRQGHRHRQQQQQQQNNSQNPVAFGEDSNRDRNNSNSHNQRRLSSSTQDDCFFTAPTDTTTTTTTTNNNKNNARSLLFDDHHNNNNNNDDDDLGSRRASVHENHSGSLLSSSITTLAQVGGDKLLSYSSKSRSQKSNNSLFSRIQTIYNKGSSDGIQHDNSRVNVSSPPPPSDGNNTNKQQHHSLLSCWNEKDLTTPPPSSSFFGQVMLRSTVMKGDPTMLESSVSTTLGIINHQQNNNNNSSSSSSSSIYKALEEEASSHPDDDNYNSITKISMEKNQSKNIKVDLSTTITTTTSLHPLTLPEKHKENITSTHNSSSFTTPNRKRKVQEVNSESIKTQNTPRQSILKDIAGTTTTTTTTTSHPEGFITKSVNWDLQQQQHQQQPQDPTTPTFTSPKRFTASPFSKHSPGGLGLWNVLQSLKSYDPTTTTSSMNQPSILEKKEEAKDGTQLKKEKVEEEEEEDWIEISFISPSSVHHVVDPMTKQTLEPIYFMEQPSIIDWTLKRSMTLDCFPYLPGQSLLYKYYYPTNQSKVIRNDVQIEFLATQIFSHNVMTRGSISEQQVLSSFSQDEIVYARWKAALMYWQYPSLHPLPMSILEQGCSSLFIDESLFNNTTAKNNTKESNKGSSLRNVVQIFNNASSINQGSSSSSSSHTLQKQFRLSGQGSLGGLGHFYSNQEDNTAERSFARMFMQRVHEWKECFQSMFMKWIDQVNHHNDSSPCSLLNIYFYSLCPGLVVLFKGYYLSSHENKHPTPLIVLSSTTTQSRHTLLCMGVELRLLDETHSTLDILSFDMLGDLENNFKKNSLAVQGNSEQDGMGNIRQSKLEHALKRSVPMYILGTKDCMRFYEYFLNTLGGQLSHNAIHTGNASKRIFDVPLLICRSLGPCRHTTLKSLSTFVKNRDDTSPEKHASCEFRGPIMPCAVNAILSSTALGLILDNKGDPMLSTKTCNDAIDENNKVGSHYFVAHLQCHQGDEIKESAKESTKSNRMGMAGLVLANDGMDNLKDDTEMMICKRGDFLSTVVWDITRWSSIMCKRDHVKP